MRHEVDVTAILEIGVLRRQLPGRREVERGPPGTQHRNGRVHVALLTGIETPLPESDANTTLPIAA